MFEVRGKKVRPDEGRFGTGRDVSRGVLEVTEAKPSQHGQQDRWYKTICVSAIERLGVVRNTKLRVVYPNLGMNWSISIF